MKKHLYLFTIIFALSVFTSVTVKADTTQNTGSNSGGLVGDVLNLLGLGGAPETPTNGQQPCTNLPVDGNIFLLTVAGVAVGVVTIKKARTTSIAINS